VTDIISVAYITLLQMANDDLVLASASGYASQRQVVFDINVEIIK